jgi:precorrin-2 dehydrogenase/sirohydrochlorin ferrochelatase
MAQAAQLFSMFLKLAGRSCVVVGAGSVAESKIESLLASGASVTVIAPRAIEAVSGWAEQKRLVWHPREFKSSDLDSAFLVISATNDPQVNASVYREAEARGVLCNAVDDPDHCDFYFPAVVRRGPLQIAISTAGYSPALAQRLRRELERRYGSEFAPWVEHLGRIRNELFRDGQLSPAERRRILHRQASKAGHRAFLRQDRTAAAPEGRL